MRSRGSEPASGEKKRQSSRREATGGLEVRLITPEDVRSHGGVSQRLVLSADTMASESLEAVFAPLVCVPAPKCSWFGCSALLGFLSRTGACWEEFAIICYSCFRSH